MAEVGVAACVPVATTPPPPSHIPSLHQHSKVTNLQSTLASSFPSFPPLPYLLGSDI